MAFITPIPFTTSTFQTSVHPIRKPPSTTRRTRAFITSQQQDDPTSQAASISEAASAPQPTATTEEASSPSSPTLPKLYDAWFEPDHELACQARAAVDRAYAAGIRKMELQWPTVPNLEEIAAGTMLNFEFGKQVSRDLGMDGQSDYPLIKRYLAQFCNLYWAKQVAKCDSFRNRVVWAVSADGVSKQRAEESLGNVRLASLRYPPKGEIGKDDVVIILDPRDTYAWVKGGKLLPEGGEGAVVFLNSQFNETYGLTGPRNGVLKGTEAVYFLKRVTRGYVYRSYPNDWLAYLENPDLSVEVVGEFKGLPKLGEIARVVREVSNARYGGFYNDRYVRGFGGRL